MNVGRLLISAAAGFVLPTFLIHRLPVTVYSAWVLILQLSAYVTFLDFGIQSGISKYVAEYEARDDSAGSSMRASAGLALLLMVSTAGVILTLILAWRVPSLFHAMPPELYRGVRNSLVLVGISASFALLCSIFASIFTGLQNYAVPTLLGTVNKLMFVAVVLTAVTYHGSLTTMAALVAIVNVTTGIMHFVAWRRLAKHVRLSLHGLDYGVLKKMVTYCSSLAVWTMAMLLVSGLDVTIVGRYDFGQTAFYSIATTPTNFLIGIISASLAPLMPTASALSVHRTTEQMGAVLARATRYASALLVVSALPLLVAGYWILRLWVGQGYAPQIVGYMRILVLANVVRMLCAPYANILVATDSQRVAVFGACAEALVNVNCSVYMVRHIGALGVAYGTLIGAFVSVGMHFALSMHFTYTKFAVTRARLFLSGIGRPLLIAIPSLILLPRWWSPLAPNFGLSTWLLWGLTSALLAWFLGLDPSERSALLKWSGGWARLESSTIE